MDRRNFFTGAVTALGVAGLASSSKTLAQATAESQIKIFDCKDDMTGSTSLNTGDIVETAGYYNPGDGGGARYLVKVISEAFTDGDVIDGYGNHTLSNGNVGILVIKDGIVLLSTFGAVGNGGGDDYEMIQAAMSAADGKTLFSDDSSKDYLVTKSVNLPDNIVIDIKGHFTLTGDVTHWFSASGAPENIIINHFEATVTTAFDSRLELNRVIFTSGADLLHVKYAKITGASTAIDTSGGDSLICDNVLLYNVLGTSSQYGYGINSSSTNNNIKNLHVENDDATNGRHALYINGGSWLNVSVGNIYVKNFNRNPVQITNTGDGGFCVVSMSQCTFENTNFSPLTTQCGCINVGVGGGTSKIALSVQTLNVNISAGPAVGSLSDQLFGTYLGRVFASNLSTGGFQSTAVIFLRNGKNQHVEELYVDSLPTNFEYGLYLRDASTASFGKVFIGGTAGAHAVRLVTSTVEVGYISTALTKLFNSGSTLTYNALQQTINYAGVAPTTGDWVSGDITWSTTLSAGGHIGWVCVASGSPGVWKLFGDIQS